MKTHRHLWDDFISRKNFASAALKALRGKKKTREIIKFMADIPGKTERLRQAVIRGEFTTSRYRTKTIHEPKKRLIHILPFYPDRIVHHALMNILIPIWDAMFYSDSFACRTGFGTHAASLRAMRFVRRSKYYLQCDIRKFYPSIDHSVMLSIIGRKIRDKKIMAIIANIVDSVDGPANLPIGNLCSQWFGNLYLNKLDAFVKQTLRVPDYVRYCDDFCLFSNDLHQLREWLDKIRRFLSDELKLEFSYAEIAQMKDGLEFLGYRHFPDRILLRKQTLGRIKRRLKKLAALPPAARRYDIHARSQLAAINGWIAHASHNIRLCKI